LADSGHEPLYLAGQRTTTFDPKRTSRPPIRFCRIRHRRADPVDIESVQRVLCSGPIQRRVIFLATPHRGSPSARRRFGRLARLLVGRRTPELQPLRRLARAPPGGPTRTSPRLQPIRHQQHLDVAGLAAGASRRRVAYAGRRNPLPRHRRRSPGGGVVPLDSAKLEGASSTLILDSDHEIYKDPRALRRSSESSQRI
jgi:hypothetical protein